MAKSKYQKDITKINERISQLVKTFGNDDTTVNAIKSYITSITDNYHFTKDGKISISQSEKNKLTEKQINKLLSYSTVGEKIKKSKQTLKRQGIEKPTRQQAISNTIRESKIKDFIREHEQEIYANKDLYQAVKRRGDENNARLYLDEVEKLFAILDTPKDINEYKDIFENERVIKWLLYWMKMQNNHIIISHYG